MKFLRKWVDRIVGGDKDLEIADRRLFLQGLAVASSGLVIPKAIVSVPDQTGPEIVWLARGATLWISMEAIDNREVGPGGLGPVFPSVVAALKFANEKKLEEPTIVLTPGYSEIVTEDFGAWPKMPKGTRIVGQGSGKARPEFRSRR